MLTLARVEPCALGPIKGSRCLVGHDKKLWHYYCQPYEEFAYFLIRMHSTIYTMEYHT